MRRAPAGFLILLLVAIAWAVLVFVTGGVHASIGAWSFSSRSARNPLIVAAASAIALWLLSTHYERRRAVPAAIAGARRSALFGAIIISITVAAIGVVRNSAVAGGSDAYGYASQADLWAKGAPIVEQPFANTMTWPNAAASLTPLGYRTHYLTPNASKIVPVFSPGYPMAMAVVERLSGRSAVFVVAPLLGGLAVFATFLLGRRIAGPLVGVSAAILFATSPPFLFELFSVSSDVPVTAWWTCALVSALASGRLAAAGAGLLTGAAILTRPNLVLVAVIPALLVGWRERRARPWEFLLFAMAAAPAVLAVGAINAHLNGSALESGYGSLGELYQWANVQPNLAHYPRWLIDAQTPVIALALLSPLLRMRFAFALLSFGALVIVPYFFAPPFDAWGDLRYFLPAYPALLVLSSAVAVFALRRLPGPRAIVPLFVAGAVGFIASHGVTYASTRGLSTLYVAEQRYRKAGEYIATTLPQRSVFLTVQHCGSVRYYADRLTVRFDAIASADLDRVVSELVRLNYHPFLLLDRVDELGFRQRFGGHSALAGLDWEPVAIIQDSAVRIYDPADRSAPAGRGRIPDIVR